MVEEAIRVAQARDFVLKMDDTYETELASGGTNISGGQKQRLATSCRTDKGNGFSIINFKRNIF